MVHTGLIVVLLNVLLSTKATEMSVSFNKEDLATGDSLVISVSVTIGNETADKPAVELHLPPKLRFTKATVDSASCQQTSSASPPCTNRTAVFKRDEGEPMGKFVLGVHVIEATVSFPLTASPNQSATTWRDGFTYRATIKLENVSSAASPPTENIQFAILVFRYWKRIAGLVDSKSSIELQRSTGKYYRVHPMQVTTRVIGDQGVTNDKDGGVRYRMSAQQTVQVTVATKIANPQLGNFVLKLVIPDSLLAIEKTVYELGSYHNRTDSAVMQTRNVTAGTIDLYVLITPAMLATSGENSAALEAWLKARDTRLTSDVRIVASVLYGVNFQNHFDAPPVNLSITAGGSGGGGVLLDPPRTVIEYAPQPRPEWPPQFDENQKNSTSTTRMMPIDSPASIATTETAPPARIAEVSSNTAPTIGSIMKADVLVSNEPENATRYPTGSTFDGGWWSTDIVLSDCYQFPGVSQSHADAEETCRRLGGHLPSFLSIYDFLALSTFWKNSLHATEIWIGLSRNTSNSSDQWRWTDKTKLGYTDWCEYYPSLTAKNCAACSSVPSDNYCWKNRYCDQSMYFFCSKPRNVRKK